MPFWADALSPLLRRGNARSLVSTPPSPHFTTQCLELFQPSTLPLFQPSALPLLLGFLTAVWLGVAAASLVCCREGGAGRVVQVASASLVRYREGEAGVAAASLVCCCEGEAGGHLSVVVDFFLSLCFV